MAVMRRARRYPFLIRQDIDGFFGLMTDNLMQLIVIGALCQHPGWAELDAQITTLAPVWIDGHATTWSLPSGPGFLFLFFSGCFSHTSI